MSKVTGFRTGYSVCSGSALSIFRKACVAELGAVWIIRRVHWCSVNGGVAHLNRALIPSDSVSQLCLVHIAISY